jgi:uncharacterized membrane protein YgdD (TMEM256/DUF423 family)
LISIVARSSILEGIVGAKKATRAQHRSSVWLGTSSTMSIATASAALLLALVQWRLSREMLWVSRSSRHMSGINTIRMVWRRLMSPQSALAEWWLLC